ncbi:MAG: DUF1295 domain-containing protein [Deltaproteobacteria bacterium]|nr:MAG: DUF1295 domain-containing protein [Deltaproteobacteria bacterium]
MSGNLTYDTVLIGMLAMAPISFAVLSWWRAPYGRYATAGGRFALPARIGWILMEAPASLAMLWFYARGSHRGDLVPLVLLGLWQCHYVDRAFVYPLRMRVKPGSRMPWSIAVSSIAFHVVNCYLCGGWIAEYGRYPTGWLTEPRCVAGVAVFASGFAINRWADRVLRNLRGPGESGYKIPRGGLYEWVSCPNFLGEILTWVGWAIASWSLAGLSFALMTAANLIPRARQHHRWYLERFPDYPKRRRAIVPCLL